MAEEANRRSRSSTSSPSITEREWWPTSIKAKAQAEARGAKGLHQRLSISWSEASHQGGRRSHALRRGRGSRALDEPTPENIESIIKKIVTVFWRTASLMNARSPHELTLIRESLRVTGLHLPPKDLLPGFNPPAEAKHRRE
jgi:hypothetical protein